MRDAKILELFFDRDPEAVRVVRDQYGVRMRSIAMDILQNSQDAEECVNDALLTAWNAIPPRRPNPLLPWLSVTVRNAALDRWRYDRAQKRRAGEIGPALEELEEVLASPDSAEDVFDRAELIRLLNRFLSLQTPKDRSILMGRYFSGLSYARIAERLGMTESGCKMRASRLRKRLQKYLEKEGGFFS